MPKAPSATHPAVQAAIDEALRDWNSTYATTADEERRRSMGRYWALRQKRILPTVVYGGAGLLAFLFMMTAFEAGSVAVGASLGALFVVMEALFARSLRSLRLTMEELAALRPALRLSRVQGAYLDSRLMIRALSLPEDTAAELAAGLDRLVDEEARLVALRDEGVGRAARPDALEAERERLAARLGAETDPVAREALAHGLATLERRLAAARGLSSAGPRIDAQLEMVAQAAEDVRDGLARMRSVPGESGLGIGMDSVREALAHVQGHASALEAAVAEVRALETRG